MGSTNKNDSARRLLPPAGRRRARAAGRVLAGVRRCWTECRSITSSTWGNFLLRPQTREQGVAPLGISTARHPPRLVSRYIESRHEAMIPVKWTARR